MGYTGYNNLARELLNMKQAGTGLGAASLAHLYSVMDKTLAHTLAAKKAQEKMGMPGASSAPPSSSNKSGHDGWDDNSKPIPLVAQSPAMQGGGSNSQEYDTEENYEQENSDSGSSSGWDSGGSSSGESSSSGDSGGYYDAGTDTSQDTSYAAKGGPVKAGKKYIVGEGGKDEVYVQGDGDVYPLTEQQGIIPKEDGTIIPNPKLRKLARVMLNNKG